jgi:hypothetical protein
VNKYADKVPSHREKMAAVMNRMRGAAKACIRKTVYPTEEAAQKAVKSLSLKFKCPMRHYHCPHCLNWHLAKEKK